MIPLGGKVLCPTSHRDYNPGIQSATDLLQFHSFTPASFYSYSLHKNDVVILDSVIFFDQKNSMCWHHPARFFFNYIRILLAHVITLAILKEVASVSTISCSISNYPIHAIIAEILIN